MSNYQQVRTFETLNDVKVPVAVNGHYLDWREQRQWKGEAQADVLTDPYEAMEYAVGNGEDEGDADYQVFMAFAELPDGRIVLHAIQNSESGGFIEGFPNAEYQVVDPKNAANTALLLVEDALDAVHNNDLEHDTEGWNQDPYYFARAVAQHCGIEPYTNMDNDKLRQGPVPTF